MRQEATVLANCSIDGRMPKAPLQLWYRGRLRKQLARQHLQCLAMKRRIGSGEHGAVGIKTKRLS